MPFWSRTKTVDMRKSVDIGGAGFDFNLVGESNYQDAIRRAKDRSDERQGSLTVIPVIIMSDPKNKHDRNAVAAYSVLGELIGYFPRKDAAGWQAGIRELERKGKVPVCKGLVTGGGEHKYFGIVLDFDDDFRQRGRDLMGG